MQFQNVKTALVTVLGAAAAGRYRTAGYKDEPIDQSEISGNNKLVSVYYKEGTFPLGTSGRFGPANHECTFIVELKLSQACSVDIATLEDTGSTNNERKTALAALQDAKDLADTNLDAFASIIHGVLTDNRNAYLGLNKKIFSDRWISRLQKQDPMVFGDMVIGTAILTYTCNVEEAFVGDVSDTGNIIDTTYKLNEETTGQTGVYVDNE